ncbi:ATP-binding cassette domain-containing protein [Streptomyces sp. NPDC058864]
MSQDTPGTAERGGTTLAELERRVIESREQPAYGHDALIVCDRLVRIFTAQGVEVQALQGLDLLVAEGELMALVGASGSGKSTLLNILAGLDTPTAGAASVAGFDLLTMNAAARLRYQREVVGFVWQQTSRNLLPYLTALQNVVLPMRLSGLAGRRDRHARATELLEMMGVGYCADRRPQQMSGGEQQRTAIAVALANRPSLVLADEPTGQLDSATAEQVFAAFRTANEQLGTTIVVVTHDQAVAAAVDRTVAIRDGRTASEVVRRTSTDDEGRTTVHASEYATVDRSGRLQLPRDFTHALDIRNRVMLELEPDHIAVRPDRPDRPADDAEGARDS